MHTFVYGNIRHKNFTYLCSTPKFFEEIRRTKALDEVIRYDVTCKHGELEREQHQSFWMLTSDLDSGIAPRLLLYASGAETYRDGGYAQGYIFGNDDGDIYGVRFLQLLRTKFQSCSEVINTKHLDSLTIDMLPLEDIQQRNLPREQMEQILAALFQSKRVVIHLREEGAAAMRASRETVLAIFERLPYELRRYNGYVTGTSRKILLDEQQKLPGAFSVVLLDGDADITGLQSDSGMFFLDMCRPEFAPPIPEEMETLVGFLTDAEPGERNQFFSFCRQVSDREKDGTPFDFSDYTTLLSVFHADQNSTTDSQLRTWAAELFGNRRKKEAKAFLYDRLAEMLTPERLTKFLLKEIPADQSIQNLGSLNDTKSDAVDQNGVKILRMAQELQQRWDEDPNNGSVAGALVDWMTGICFRQNAALLNTEVPTVAVAQHLDNLLWKIQPNANIPLVWQIQNEVHQRIRCRCNEIKKGVEHAGLCVIQKGLSPAEAKEYLQTVMRMQKDGLAGGDISFLDWEEIGPASQILEEIQAIEAYRVKGKVPQPRLVNPSKREWVCRYFPDSKDLQIALAKQEENGRTRLTTQWAALEDTGEWVETLYIHCWPEELLKYGAGVNTSESWHRAVEALFPLYPGEQR